MGTSGWKYRSWRGVFYPENLPHSQELEFISSIFPSLEINGTFYSLKRPHIFERWFEETPDNFIFSIKGGRFITHMKKLLHIKKPLANFFASGVLALGHKLGPILWQFPTSLRFEFERFSSFFSELPASMEEASVLAKKHDYRVSGRSKLKQIWDGPVRHAVEVRHESFHCQEFLGLLKKHSIALVASDGAKRWRLFKERTTDFIYLKFHGEGALYTGNYRRSTLVRWTDYIRSELKRAATAYVYFDNDAKVFAPFNAHTLSTILGNERVTKSWENAYLPASPN
ncbi:MAG: DUF72 domain-containing protein [Deltaproteobacteria bacterium]|nr:DUF72 domain-containing protein [Deltaproteobacteria bacterium]